jgi:NAD(P)-dependent dehydrogenase (short-subunit alcohol dehydrogenase family)
VAEIDFDKRAVIVTGAGQGLGRAHALELARRGASVVVNDLGGASDGTGSSSSAADQVVDEITQAGGAAVANYDSVASPEGGQAIVQTALDTYGRVDAVINNAGILRDKSFSNMSFDDVHAVLDVHLKGAFYVTQPAFKAMKGAGYGRLVFTASNAGVFGNFGQANYGAAKMGLVGLANVLAIEGAKYDVKSNVIMPVARTRMTEELLGPMADKLDPELVTPLVVYLASEACQVTHEAFSAAAGRYARVFVGLAKGWFAGPGNPPSAEDIVAHWDDIEDQDGYLVPMGASDELQQLLPLLQG